MTAPKLRFCEFIDEWKVGKLDDITEMIKDGTHGSFRDYSGGIPLLSAKDIRENKIFSDDNPRRISQKDFDTIHKTYSLKNGDVLLTIVGSLGRSAIVHDYKNNYTLQRSVAILRMNNSSSPEFVLQVFQTKKFQRELKLRENKAIQSGIYLGELTKVPISLPSLPEQQKIAQFLSAVDARIDAASRKLELLRDYKTAVSQKIFSREIRFPGFTDEWTSRKLGKISQKMKSGGTPTSTNKSYYDGEIPFLSIADMTEQGKYLTKTTKMITGSGLANSSAWLVPKDSLIYSMYASVGLVAINKIPIATSQAMMDIIPDENFAILEFIYYALDNFRNKVSRYVMTGTQGNLNAGVVKNIEIALPTLPEQQEIANFLSALDDKISQNSRKLSALREFKKVLLQRLFL